MNAIVSEKRQVTIPKALREKLGLRPGCVLQFTDANGVLQAKKYQRQDPLRKWRGRSKIPDGLSVDQYLNRVRDEDCR